MTQGDVRAMITVSGSVQGVGYRFFVQREALKLGLAGYVMNLPSGDSVLAEAEGSREAVESLIELLRKGPAHARVTSIKTEFRKAEGGENGFSIRY